MPQITSVEPQKKKKERFNVFVDGKFAFGANAELVLKYGLKSGKNLSQNLIDLILKKEETARLFDSALNFLTYRPRSQKELEGHLSQKISNKENVNYSQAAQSQQIIDVIKKLKKYKYLNDLEFAKWWIKSRTKARPKGKIVLKSELIQKGVDREVIDSLLEKIGSQKNMALKAIEKKVPRWHKLPDNDFKKKIYSHLASRGFDFNTIAEVVAHFQKKR